MATRLRANNPLDVAALWLSEQNNDLNGYQAEDILEDASLGKIQLWAVVPDWQSVGEIAWLKREKKIADAQSGAYTLSSSVVGDFVSGDGCIRVTEGMAKRLLVHGECGLDCVSMPIIDCSSDALEPSDVWLQGTRDGRLIKIEHIRVTRDDLQAFVSAANKQVGAAAKEVDLLPGVGNKEILSAPWQYPIRFSEKQLGGLLREQPKWFLEARIREGRQGVASPMWNPAVVAKLLHDEKHFTLHRLTKVINDNFPDYLGEWNEYKDVRSTD